MYYKRQIGLTNAQVKHLQHDIDNKTLITFTKYNATDKAPIYLTQAQVAKLGNGLLTLGVRQLDHMQKQEGFLGALLKLIGPVMKVIAPATKTVAKIVGPAEATKAIRAAANYRTRKAMEGKKGRCLQIEPYKKGRGLELKPFKGGNVIIEITLPPREVNAVYNEKEVF